MTIGTERDDVGWESVTVTITDDDDEFLRKLEDEIYCYRDRMNSLSETCARGRPDGEESDSDDEDRKPQLSTETRSG